jgi:hypothetical protein
MQIESLYNDKWKTQLDVMNKEIDRTWQADQNEIEREWQAEQSEIERGWKEKEAQLDRNFQSTQAQIERKFKEAQAELDRKHDFAVIKANTQAEKERADYEHKLALDKLAKQQEYEMAQMQKQYENEKSLLSYQNSLRSSSSGGSGGGGSSGGSGTQFGKPQTGSGQTSYERQLQSILSLGYGPISEATLNSLVSAGVVEEYISNGVKLFRKAKNGTVKSTANNNLASTRQNIALFSNSVNDSFRRG